MGRNYWTCSRFLVNIVDEIVKEKNNGKRCISWTILSRLSGLLITCHFLSQTKKSKNAATTEICLVKKQTPRSRQLCWKIRTWDSGAAYIDKTSPGGNSRGLLATSSVFGLLTVAQNRVKSKSFPGLGGPHTFSNSWQSSGRQTR